MSKIKQYLILLLTVFACLLALFVWDGIRGVLDYFLIMVLMFSGTFIGLLLVRLMRWMGM